MIFQNIQTSSSGCCYLYTNQDNFPKSILSIKEKIKNKAMEIINPNYLLINNTPLTNVSWNMKSFEYEFTTFDLMLLSEKSLSEEWLSDEEDLAWQDL